MLLAYKTSDQVRQLFSDHNLNAKPASKTIGYDFETRDPLALVAKDIIEKVPLFAGRVNRVTNSLPKSSRHVVTLNTLVQAVRPVVDSLAKTKNLDKDEFLADQSSATTDVADVFETIVDAFADYWKPVTEDEAGAAGELREEYVFPHGLAWQALGGAAAKLITELGSNAWKAPFKEAVQSFDWHRTAPVWDGTAVIHDPCQRNEPGQQHRTGRHATPGHDRRQGSSPSGVVSGRGPRVYERLAPIHVALARDQPNGFRACRFRLGA